MSPKTNKEIVEDALKRPNLGVIFSPSKRDQVNDDTTFDHSDY